MGALINKALTRWPSERFPEGFQSYWEHRFRGYGEQSVADALEALKMESDPYVPTCEAVERILREWGVARLRVDGPTWDRQAYDNSKAEAERIVKRNAVDNALCAQLPDDQFNEIAKGVLANLDADLAAFLSKRPPRKQQLIRSMVAEHARAHGLVKSQVMEAV